MVGENGFDIRFIRRFYRIQKIIFPRLLSPTVALFSTLLFLNLLEQVVIYFVGLVPSRFYKVLGDKDLEAFQVQTAISLGIILSISFVKSTKSFVKDILALSWRRLLTQQIHAKYFLDIQYYKLNVLNKELDNP
ncbi:lysosomal cobalamin transporter ABCD4-like [Artemia franciscana]